MTVYFGAPPGGMIDADDPGGSYLTEGQYTFVGRGSGYTEPPMVAAEAGTSSGGVFDSIASIFKSIATGVVGVASVVQPGSKYYQPPTQTPPPQTGMPGWVLPAVLVGGGIVLLVALKSRRGGRRYAGRRRSRR